MVGATASSASAVVALQVRMPVLVLPLTLILAVMVGKLLSTLTDAAELMVAPWSSVAVMAQLMLSEGVELLGSSCRVLETEP